MNGVTGCSLAFGVGICRNQVLGRIGNVRCRPAVQQQLPNNASADVNLGVLVSLARCRSRGIASDHSINRLRPSRSWLPVMEQLSPTQAARTTRGTRASREN